jgi:uncharacterized repeat protein (TIGR01451 family)
VTVLGLTLTKTASPNPVAPGGTITYTFTIDNPGTLEVPGVTLVDSIIDASGTWNGTVPDPLPAGTTEITATLVAPDEAPTEVENIAQLLVDEVQVDEASVTVRVLEPGLFVTINEVYQLVPNTADPANPIHVNPPLPLQTGRPVYIAFTMLNSGSETLNNPTYQTRSKAQYQLDTQWQVFSCSRLSPATMPESLAPGDQVDVVCQFTPPVALAQYFELDGAGLYRNLEVIGAGKTAADQTLTGSDTEDITLVDLKLGVDL